jgi:Fe-S cluster assembly iron-binding protein IscA
MMTRPAITRHRTMGEVREAYQRVAGATLDDKDGLNGAGFHTENPNAQRPCGCGQWFS